jgi:hypothetical protein
LEFLENTEVGLRGQKGLRMESDGRAQMELEEEDDPGEKTRSRGVRVEKGGAQTREGRQESGAGRVGTGVEGDGPKARARRGVEARELVI